MKKIKRIISIVMCIFIFGMLCVNATDNSKDVYPGTPLITYESVTGVKFVDSTNSGGKIRCFYPYDETESWRAYLRELESVEGWKKVEENVSGGENIYSRQGYVVQINVDKISKFVCVTVFKDDEGKYEVIDNSVITVYVNGQKLDFDVEPQLIDGRTMVPMRTIFEALNSDVKWDDNTKKITALKVYNEYSTNIEMQINSKTMRVNDEAVELDVAPTIIDGRTLVPVRAVSEALKVNVDWHGAIKAVDIYAEQPKTTVLYDEKENIINAPSYLIKKYEHCGYAKNKEAFNIIMYHPDGSTKSVKKLDVEAEESNGWYKYPVVTIYKTDGSGTSMVVAKSDVNTYEGNGWSRYNLVINDSEALSLAKDGVNYIRSMLKNPSSLQLHSAYAGYFEVQYGLSFSVLLDISAMNGFGGYNRTTYRVWYSPSGILWYDESYSIYDFVGYSYKSIDVNKILQ